jgi:hypothetical protein
MDLVNEYLRAVAAQLPKAQRDDIIAELRDTILTRIEAREAELGRPLTGEETEAVLREVGHPLVVAARYREGPQHVVGPALYPYWMFVVKVAIIIQIAVSALVLVIRILSGGDFAEAWGRAFGSGITGAITLIGFATVAAWLIERQGWRIPYLDEWRVKDLRVLEFGAWDWDGVRDWFASGGAQPSESGPGRPSQPWRFSRRRRSLVGRALGSIAGGAVLVLWWLGVLRFDLIGNVSDLRELGLEPGRLSGVDWPGLMHLLFWPVLAYGLAIIAQGMAILAFPRAAWLRGLFDLAIGGGVIALAVTLWTASPISTAIQVDSLSGFAVSIKAAFENGPPIPLAPLVSLALAISAFGGIGRMLRGLWEIMSPGGDTAARPSPARR